MTSRTGTSSPSEETRTAGRVTARRAAIAAGVGTAALSAVSAAGSLGAASYFARVLLTPERDRPDNVRIVAVDDARIVLDVTEDTVQPGRYGLWFDAGAGHLRVGDILGIDAEAGEVTRRLEGVDTGAPAPGPARWDGYYHASAPDESLGLPCENVLVPGELDDLPAWRVPAADDTPTPRRWAVLVHGRGATRHECLRAVPTLRRCGLTCLVPTYRNDPEGPPSPDGLYNLGLSEWRDTEAAMRYALAHGAEEIVLAGWSMGGAIVLQTLDRSELSRHVVGVVLDGPVIDWGDVIDHHARLRRIPAWLAMLAQSLIGAPWAHRIVGVHEALDVAATNWQHRADEITHPMLLVHSVDDEFVPVGPSTALARRRPDLVRYEEWSVARHVREWNVDPDRWERVVAEFVTGTGPGPALPAPRRRGADRPRAR